MIDDIIINKKESIERCIGQIRSYYARPSDLSFEDDYLRQDAIAINLQRAAELCIDLANHVVRKRRLGLPKESRDGFVLLQKSGIIDSNLLKSLVAMVGFRNTLVHAYRDLDIGIMKDVVENHLDELVDFTNVLLTMTE